MDRTKLEDEEEWYASRVLTERRLALFELWQKIILPVDREGGGHIHRRCEVIS